MKTSHLIAAAAAVSMLLAACSASSKPASAPTTTIRPGPFVAPTGCGHRVPLGTATETLTLGGAPRTFIVHVPSGYSDTRRTPLVLNLHGSASTAEAQELFSGMNATADADDFVVVYPQADIKAGAGFDWNIPGVPLIGGAKVPPLAADDEAFLQDVVSELGLHECIDTKRVYVTGFSGGARMSSQLGCDAPKVFAAIAPVSGLRLPSPCSGARPVPVISFHGLVDPVDPYNGHGQAYWTYSVPTAAQRWAAHDGCSPAARTTQPDAGVTLTSYTGCRGDSQVELYTIAAEGHEWPGGPKLTRRTTRLLGPQVLTFDANAAIWSFFEAHPLP